MRIGLFRGRSPGRALSCSASRRRPVASLAALDGCAGQPWMNRSLTPDELEFGGVTVNEAPTFRADQMPYGGVKDSGNTREGPAYAVRELTEERVVVVELP